MKYLVIISLLICSQVFAHDLNGVQVIKVADTQNELLTGARVEIPGTNYVFYTNIRGECYIPSHILKQYSTLRIHCISYKTLDINTKEVSSSIVLQSR